MQKLNSNCRQCGKPTGNHSFMCSDTCRLRSRCRVEGDCWLWTGPINPGSRHGLLHTTKGVEHVPSVIARLAGLAPTAQQQVVMTCDEDQCCNPAHAALELRMVVRPKSPLSDADVLAIYRDDSEGQRLTARKYGVSSSTIARIRNGMSWNHITGAERPKDKKD